MVVVVVVVGSCLVQGIKEVLVGAPSRAVVQAPGSASDAIVPVVLADKTILIHIMLFVALHMVWGSSFSDICVCAAAIGMLFQIGSFGNESHVSKVQDTVYETETDVHISPAPVAPVVSLFANCIRITFRNLFSQVHPEDFDDEYQANQVYHQQRHYDGFFEPNLYAVGNNPAHPIYCQY